jgi:hypothetical protein
MGVGGQRYGSAALPPEMNRCSLHWRMGVLRGSVWNYQENWQQPAFNLWTVQPLASCYTDCAISAKTRNSEFSF